MTLTTFNGIAYEVGNSFQGMVVVSVDSAVYVKGSKSVIIPNANNASLEDAATETVYAQNITVREYDRKAGTVRKGSRKNVIIGAYVRSETVRTEIGAYTNIWQ